MLTDTYISKEDMEKLLLRNLELLKEVESLKEQLRERDAAIDCLTKQRDTFYTGCTNLNGEMRKLRRKEDGNQS